VDTSNNTELTQQLRKHWDKIEPQIISRYSGVEQADLQGFTDYGDLLQRVSAKADLPVDKIETEFRQLVETASSH
jgi:hypothetical protein